MSANRKYNLIHQRGKGDCGIACFAMMMGLSYDGALECFPRFKHENGTTEPQIIGAIGYHFDIHVSRTDGFVSSVPGILTVPSLSKRGILHYVFWTGLNVYDPQQEGDRYTNDMLSLAVVNHIYSLDLKPETTNPALMEKV